MPGSKSSPWLVVDEKFIFQRTQQEQARKNRTKTLIWNCSGRRNHGCMARALTHWVPREGASQPQAGCLVDLVWVWRSQLHTCNGNNGSYIFTTDLKNRIKQCLLEDPTMKYKKPFRKARPYWYQEFLQKTSRKIWGRSAKWRGTDSGFMYGKRRATKSWKKERLNACLGLKIHKNILFIGSNFHWMGP